MRPITRGVVIGLWGLSGCAILPEVIQPPQFDHVTEPHSEIRVFGPRQHYPLGGAILRIWTRVHNPNPLSVRVTSIDGALFLEGIRAAGVDLPLGVPLLAGRDTIIPLDFDIGFADVPDLAQVALRAATGREFEYRIDGTVGVDAGALGEPVFGPLTLLRGEVTVIR